MKITESRLRSVIRQVIAESGPRNMFLDGWLRDSAVKKCENILKKACKYVPTGDDRAGIQSSEGDNVLTLDGDRIILSDELSEAERIKLLEWLDTCGVLKNGKTCAGVFYTPPGGSTQKLIP